MDRLLLTRGAVALIALVLGSCGAAAQSVQDFYKGKTIQLAIGFGPGASGDIAARMSLLEIEGRIAAVAGGLFQRLRGR